MQAFSTRAYMKVQDVQTERRMKGKGRWHSLAAETSGLWPEASGLLHRSLPYFLLLWIYFHALLQNLSSDLDLERQGYSYT